MQHSRLAARREFLKFLAASPYVAAFGGVAAFLESAFAQNPAEISDVISDPKQALDVMEFEEAAHRKIDPGHWAYMASGVDDDATLRANHEAYKHVELRPRRLRDATKVDMRVELFGEGFSSPIFLCPVGGEGAFFPEGELAAARAAKAHGTMQILSTVTTTPVEDVNKALGRPTWYQLYAPNSWAACEAVLRRVEAAVAGWSRSRWITRRVATARHISARAGSTRASAWPAIKASPAGTQGNFRCLTAST